MHFARKFSAKILAGILAVSMLLGAAGPVFAQSARTANWTTSITYQNIGNAPTPVTLSLYQEGLTTPVNVDLGSLNANAAASYFVGRVNDPAFTRGGGIMLSNQPLVATVVQFSNDPGFRMRLLYNGFSGDKSSAQYLVATTLLRVFGRTTIFSIQNTENQAIDATVRFYNAATNPATLASTKTFVIPANSTKIIEMDNVDDTGLTGALANSFNGSAIITAKLQGTQTDAKVVAAASEYYTDVPIAANFEGQPTTDAATLINMATALCRNFGLDTFYAIQNASLTSPTQITVRYFNLDGSAKAVHGPIPVGAGGKHSANTCLPSDGTNMTGFTGSATIESTGGVNIVAIGKAQNSLLAGGPNTQDVLTAFLGERAGAEKLALPFARWGSEARYNAPANNGGVQRSFIAIQNIGTTTIPVGQLRVEYRDKNGVLVNTHTNATPVAPKAKFNTNANLANALGQSGMNPGEFGYYTDGTFGGGVVVTGPAGSQLIAVARVQNPGAGEDYNGAPVP